MTKTQPKGNFFVSEPHPYSIYLSYAAMAVVVTGAVFMFENVMYKTQIHFHNYIPCRLFSALWMIVCIMLKQGMYFTYTALGNTQLSFNIHLILWCIFAHCNFSVHAISSERMTAWRRHEQNYEHLTDGIISKSIAPAFFILIKLSFNFVPNDQWRKSWCWCLWIGRTVYRPSSEQWWPISLWYVCGTSLQWISRWMYFSYNFVTRNIQISSKVAISYSEQPACIG